MNSITKTCPFCNSENTSHKYTDRIRDYYTCKNCDIIFVPKEYFLNSDEEKERYDYHQNSPDDPRYRTFLYPLFHSVKTQLKADANGMDFGCGPGPTLSKMFEEAGFFITLFDYFYYPDSSVFQKKFDFITASELVEHLHAPKFELDRLWSCLNPGGIIGIMTKLNTREIIFKNWHYIKDDTHVCFFSASTFEWLAKRWDATVKFPAKNVILLYKKG